MCKETKPNPESSTASTQCNLQQLEVVGTRSWQPKRSKQASKRAGRTIPQARAWPVVNPGRERAEKPYAPHFLHEQGRNPCKRKKKRIRGEQNARAGPRLLHGSGGNAMQNCRILCNLLRLATSPPRQKKKNQVPFFFFLLLLRLQSLLAEFGARLASFATRRAKKTKQHTLLRLFLHAPPI